MFGSSRQIAAISLTCAAIACAACGSSTAADASGGDLGFLFSQKPMESKADDICSSRSESDSVQLVAAKTVDRVQVEASAAKYRVSDDVAPVLSGGGPYVLCALVFDEPSDFTRGVMVKNESGSSAWLLLE